MEAEEAAQADDLLAQVRDLHSRTLTILEASELTPEHKTALAAIREARSNLELLGEITKEPNRTPTLKLQLNGLLSLEHRMGRWALSSSMPPRLANSPLAMNLEARRPRRISGNAHLAQGGDPDGAEQEWRRSRSGAAADAATWAGRAASERVAGGVSRKCRKPSVHKAATEIEAMLCAPRSSPRCSRASTLRALQRDHPLVDLPEPVGRSTVADSVQAAKRNRNASSEFEQAAFTGALVRAQSPPNKSA